MPKRQQHGSSVPERRHTAVRSRGIVVLTATGLLACVIALLLLTSKHPPSLPGASRQQSELIGWTARARAVSALFHRVYTPCWEGAYGAIGDSYLFALTHDSSLWRFHLLDHDLRKMCEGTWVDDAAWVCLAELRWWEVTGKANMSLIMDAARRYHEARSQGRLSRAEGFWAWYNWPPNARVQENIFTNSNMNQMAAAACGLFRATGDRRYLQDAQLVWEGDGSVPGISQVWYEGHGVWKGRDGAAAFGKELPWGGLGCASLAAALFTATGKRSYREIAVETVRRLLDPSTGWVDPTDFFQLRMDGNGAFVNFLLDVYAIAPDDLNDVPAKIERMLEHVWTNHRGHASVTLHRTSDHGIRNGWNPDGGEDGYGVGEIGTVHAQGEAARAFGTFAFFYVRRPSNVPADAP